MPAPTIDDTVAAWEMQYLPAIDAHMQAGRLDSVIAVCRLALLEDSTRIVLYNLMASAYASQGRYAPAQEALLTAVRLAPGFTSGWVNLGGMHTRQGQFREALPYLQRAAQLDATDAATRRRLGEVYLRTHQPELAVAEIRAAMGLLPGDATLNFRLGAAQQELGAPQDALESFLRAGALDPGYAAAHARAADLARQLQQTVVADSCLTLHDHLLAIVATDTLAAAVMQQLRDAIGNAPEAAIHHARLGGFYLYNDYLPQALALFERAAHLEPEDAWMLNEFGGLLSQKGLGEQALVYYRRALQGQPDFGPAMINTGGLLNALGRHQEALPLFERAAMLAPEDANVQFYLAVTYLSLGQSAAARQGLETALGLVTDNDASRQQTDALRQQIEAALAAIDSSGSASAP